MAKRTTKTLAPNPDVATGAGGRMSVTPQPPLRGKIVPKKGSGKSDRPDDAGDATHRKSVLYENMGARFGVQGINMNALPGSNPEAQATQANGIPVRSAGRLANFGGGISYSNAG